jgi:signal transduction histidine kinase
VVVLCVGAITLGNLATVIPLLSLCPTAEREFAEVDWIGIALVLLGAVSLAWRRQAPLTVLAITATAFCAGLLLGYPPAQPLAPVIALYALAVVHSSLVTASAGAAAALVIVTATATHLGWQGDFDDRVFENLMLLCAACMLGYGIQLGRTRKSVLMAQEARLAREHTAEMQQAVRDEKSRIARELHDVVAHNVSVITAQATGAQRVFDTEPELARDALRSIETTGRGALTEMRRLLGVLQLETDNAAIEPQPGLDQLPFLIAQMERSGLTVDLKVSGDPRPLSSGVQLTAFRIVQEALTNTLKHAGPSRAQVELRYRADHLDVRVGDNGKGFSADAVPGHGVIGMRQRAAMLGGDLSVLQNAAGGVLVDASLPTET